MDNDFKMQIIIITKDNKEKRRIANLIHNQLVGNKDYINCNIILNDYYENEINLFIFNECENIPNIVI